MLDAAIDIARQAGAVLMKYFHHVRAESKGEFDLITEADRASERLIVAELRRRFPDHAILAEEGSGRDCQSDFRWYVDPLDGTTNFAHGFPVFNVTLALEERGELTTGVIFDPLRDELFHAVRGQGACLNGKPIAVSPTPDLDSALRPPAFPAGRDTAT